MTHMTSWRGERWHQFLFLSISWSVVFGFREQREAIWRHLSISWLSVLVFGAGRRARYYGDTACRSADRWVTSLPIDQLIGRSSLWGGEKSEALWRHCLSISWSVSDVASLPIDQLIGRSGQREKRDIMVTLPFDQLIAVWRHFLSISWMIVLVLEAECEQCAAMIACLVKLFLPLWRCKRVTSLLK